jgi:hypothetical protein
MVRPSDNTTTFWAPASLHGATTLEAIVSRSSTGMQNLYPHLCDYEGMSIGTLIEVTSAR